MSDKKVTFNLGGWFVGILTLMFVWFKIHGQIDWSWWLVFGPLWIPAAIIIGIIATPFIGIGILYALVWVGGFIEKKYKKWKRNNG